MLQPTSGRAVYLVRLGEREDGAAHGQAAGHRAATWRRGREVARVTTVGHPARRTMVRLRSSRKLRGGSARCGRLAVGAAGRREPLGAVRADRATVGICHRPTRAVDAPAVIVVADGVRREGVGSTRLAVEVESGSGRRRGATRRRVGNGSAAVRRGRGARRCASRDRDHHHTDPAHAASVGRRAPFRNAPHFAAPEVRR